MKKAIVMGLLALNGCVGIGATADAPCYVVPTTFNADDPNVTMRLQMLNTGRFCGFSVSMDRAAGASYGVIIRQPEHGRARITRSTTGVAFAQYRPVQGFVGRDEYVASLGSGAKQITVVVIVEAPP